LPLAFFHKKALLSAALSVLQALRNFGTMFVLMISSVPSYSFSPAAVGYLVRGVAHIFLYGFTFLLPTPSTFRYLLFSEFLIVLENERRSPHASS
jgi:hypothetical protein